MFMMMLNKNVKTEGNPTLLKLQYGRHRMSRSATHRRDSEEPEDRRLKSALNIKHPHIAVRDDDASRKLDKKESMSDFYSKNPQLSKASLNLNKKSVLNDSYGNLRHKSVGYNTTTDEVTGFSFDPEEEFDFDADGKVIPYSIFIELYMSYMYVVV